MTGPLELDGKEYISSKRAAELSGYTQDYVGQLARGGHIDARRISGLWYVQLESLQKYKAAAETYTPEPPKRSQFGKEDPEALIMFDGKDYISAARASKLTGYHADYVGQLARTGAVSSRQVGNRWYVEREGLLAHKSEKDALLAAVQRDSVGIAPKSHGAEGAPAEKQESVDHEFYRYVSESGDLLPTTIDHSAEEVPVASAEAQGTEDEYGSDEEVVLPIHRARSAPRGHSVRRLDTVGSPRHIYAQPRKTIISKRFVILTALATLVVGFPLAVYLGRSSVTPAASTPESANSGLIGFLENLVAHQVNYSRSQ